MVHDAADGVTTFDNRDPFANGVRGVGEVGAIRVNEVVEVPFVRDLLAKKIGTVRGKDAGRVVVIEIGNAGILGGIGDDDVAIPPRRIPLC